MVGQSMHGSVIDTPYFNLARFELTGWLPASILLSSIAPMTAPLPAHTCSTSVRSTSGCLVKSSLVCACEQSTIMRGSSAALASILLDTANVAVSACVRLEARRAYRDFPKCESPQTFPAA